MKNNIKTAALIIPLIIAAIFTPVAIYSHNHVVAEAVCGNEKAANINGDTIQEIIFTFNNLKK